MSDEGPVKTPGASSLAVIGSVIRIYSSHSTRPATPLKWGRPCGSRSTRNDIVAVSSSPSAGWPEGPGVCKLQKLTMICIRVFLPD